MSYYYRPISIDEEVKSDIFFRASEIGRTALYSQCKYSADPIATLSDVISGVRPQRQGVR